MPTPTATIFLPYHALDDVILRGTRAAQPAASAVVAGTLYGVTDEGNLVERSTGTVWQAYSPTGGGGAPAAHHVSHEPGGSDALANLSATTLTSGTLPDARLSANVALRDNKNYFSDDQFIQKPGASVRLIDTNGGVNQRLWVMGCDIAPDFYFQSRTDAGAITANAAIFRRNGDVNIGKDVYEKGRLTPVGHWTDFTPVIGVSAGSLSSLVNAACHYTLIGATCVLGFYLSFTLSVPAGVTINLPAGIVSAGYNNATIMMGVSASLPGTAQAGPGGTILTLYKDLGGTLWAAGSHTLAATVPMAIQ